MELTIRLTVEPLLVGMNLTALDDTNASPQAAQYDELRAEPPARIEADFRAAWPDLAQGFILQAGSTRIVPELVAIVAPEAGDLSLPRDSILTLRAALPPDGSPVQVGWSAAYGSLVVRQSGGDEDAYAALLKGGSLSEPLPRDAVVSEGAAPVFLRYIVSGFQHIVPKGLDHILFVLGLFFFALRARPILAQVTSFTLAHTVTLALASLGIVSVPASIVEPLIAASIVYVAVENVFGGKVGAVRIAVVFGFGLLHGLGFASVLGDVGLTAGRFVVGLIGFNIGVELGQVAVLAVAFGLVGYWFRAKPWYRSRIAIPGSALIALVGAFWFVQRTIGF